MRVLLVEDDELIGKGIVAGLRAHGISVHHVCFATEAEAAQIDDTFHALILDLGLPDREGLELLAIARAVDPFLPVLILTARDSMEHRLNGLNSGADDYMTKPFDLRELAARLHALVRRTQGRTNQIITAGPLRLEPATGLAWFESEVVTLSRREVDLLTHLATADGRWVPPDMLSERLYGSSGEINSNALNVHIHNIRRKLRPEAIETTRGLGYRLGWKLAS